MALVDEFTIPNLDDSGAESLELASLAGHLRNLARYVDFKDRAQYARKLGGIATAERAERRSQEVYDKLPHSWRW